MFELGYRVVSTLAALQALGVVGLAYLGRQPWKT